MGRRVFTLEHPTRERVQNFTLPRQTEARVVTIKLPPATSKEGKELRFREVEIYNGPLYGKCWQ